MERLYGVVVCGLGIVILWQGGTLSIGSLRSPGSGFFPVLIGAVIIILSVLLTLFPPKGASGDRAGAAKTAKPIPWKGFVRTASVFAALALYAVFLEYLGFLIVSFVLTMILFVAFGSQSYLRAIFNAAVSTGFAYGLFEVLLKSNLPRGILGF